MVQEAAQIAKLGDKSSFSPMVPWNQLLAKAVPANLAEAGDEAYGPIIHWDHPAAMQWRWTKGAVAAPAGLGCKKHKDFQRFPRVVVNIPSSPAGCLLRPAVRAWAREAGNAHFPMIFKVFE